VEKIVKKELIGFCRYWLLSLLVIVMFCCVSCDANDQVAIFRQDIVPVNDNKYVDTSCDGNKKLSDAAKSIIDGSINYDGRYMNIDYPMGDVPADMGVCTDVVIRAYRKLGIDLQPLIFTDMISNPHYYGDKPDKNISHRRVPNMRKFFLKNGFSKSIYPTSNESKNFSPGDIVIWKIGINNHIGIVVDEIGPSGNYMIVHNIGSGQNMDDCLFDWTITGHFTYDAVSNILDKDKIVPKR